ncbi:DNA-directed RNA polymerase subunit P [Natronolimnohabitans sp. A-GB9]|nr:DNA-directed RNA polymerase subunit P [Natronolimnohabitans sp. A-GB9]MDQ2049301.1 DNA-directed RNA polymerase subunit P [Natronolimnohabitans sp. A-GB9]
MGYTCVNCKSDVELTDSSYQASVRCPYCGHRIWLKERAHDTKSVNVG